MNGANEEDEIILEKLPYIYYQVQFRKIGKKKPGP